MTTTAEAAEESVPRDGSLVEVRGQRWVVSDSSPGSDGSTLLTLQSVEDGHYGESEAAGERMVDGVVVKWISPSLEPGSRSSGNPQQLAANAGTSLTAKM